MRSRIRSRMSWWAKFCPLCRIGLRPYGVCQVDGPGRAGADRDRRGHDLKVGDLVPGCGTRAFCPAARKSGKENCAALESNGMLCSLAELGLTKHDFQRHRGLASWCWTRNGLQEPTIVRALDLDDVSVDLKSPQPSGLPERPRPGP